LTKVLLLVHFDLVVVLGNNDLLKLMNIEELVVNFDLVENMDLSKLANNALVNADLV